MKYLRSRKLGTSKGLVGVYAQGTSLFRSAELYQSFPEFYVLWSTESGCHGDQRRARQRQGLQRRERLVGKALERFWWEFFKTQSRGETFIWTVWLLYCIVFKYLYSAPQQPWPNRGAFGSISSKKRDELLRSDTDVERLDDFH